ncbi:glycosyltransferase [Niastella caeni]|uniref:Glycosyltransferase n=1 Tax=Niastella caeni TaxID=2569763 RepID=A0A4S8HEM9_9BACT|nr:glycosyltransferase [Niastella caeni]THU33528.1 glycosyltransferase [Niastella caeni]
MRICIITKYLPPASTEGIPRNRWDYARQFRALGHEVHIITCGRDACEKIIDDIYIHQISGWEKKASDAFYQLQTPGNLHFQLAYSYLVYKRIRQLNELYPIHIIESPLWDIEGYITRLKLPEIPFIVRLETTSMLLKEVLSGKTPKKDVLNEIETHFLEIADGYVFDSWSILKETERLYKVRFEKKPYAVIHHGIDLKGIKSPEVPVPVANGNCRILSVGRLEKRKGSDILVKEIMPLLLENVKGIEIHLVGKDSGEWDGFKEETGFTYHEYIHKHFKQYLNKQIFLYGYVSDEKLDTLYEKADIVFALSKYESFGLLYLEAMRKGKPLIVFETGAVPEIFDDGKDAIVIPLTEPHKVIDSVQRLKDNPALCHQIGQNGLQKLINRFSAERMAAECAVFFEKIVFKNTSRVFQIMNCLTDRDGVSNTTVDYDKLLKEEGVATQILGTYPSPAVQQLVKPIESVQFTESDAIIYHYWNYCEKGDYFNKLTFPKKAFFFHNITTPDFFSVDDEAYHTTFRGFKQLSTLDNFDVYIGHTAYSLEILRQSLARPIATHIIPPHIDKDLILNRPFNKELAKSIRAQYPFHIIFVGSIAPHKKQTDLVKFFKYYSEQINADSHLSIIGGGAPSYVNELVALIKELSIGKKVTVTGKVSNDDLYAYYRSADIYLSMCEHEGFGVPLAEAMVFDLPVVAFNCTAVPDTVGQNGCLFRTKDVMLVTEIVEKIRKDEPWRKEVLSRQCKHLEHFSKQSIAKAFADLHVLLDEKHFERITFLKKDTDLLLEEYIFYNDSRLKSLEPVQLKDDQLMLVNHLSGITVEEVFSSFEINFLSHDWSGKVKVQIDDHQPVVFDLFSSDRKLKNITIDEELETGLHTIKIWQTGERNSFAKGNEVFLHSIKLKKPFNVPDKTAFEALKQVVQPDSEATLTDDDDMLEIAGEETTSGEPKILRRIEEADVLNDLFVYTPEWSVKDEHFKFSDGTQGGSIEFEKEFTSLAFKFVAHAWSGMVEVTVDNRYRETIDLYNTEHEEKVFRLKKVFKQQSHHVTIKALSRRNSFSRGSEVFFKGALFEQHLPVQVSEEELAANYKVSVIINTLDRDEHLEKLLKALEAQTYSWFEIVVVNGPSKDRTEEILAGYQGRIKVGSCPEANLSQSRNIGIEMAAGNYVAFIDDDALPCDEHWIENFIYFIIWNRSLKIGAVGGPVKHKNTEHYEFKNGATSDYGFQIFREEELKSHTLDGKRWVQGVPGGNNIVLKSALYEIGGFDERFIYYLDETDMCIRLAREGYVIINNPINHIKHFKAPGTRRKSPYDIRWDIIARSDMYYALKTGYDVLPVRVVKAIRYFKKKHFFKEVVKAYKDNVISKDEYIKYRQLLKKGFYEGLKWGLFNKKQSGPIIDKSGKFHNFKKG